MWTLSDIITFRLNLHRIHTYVYKTNGQQQFESTTDLTTSDLQQVKYMVNCLHSAL